MHLFLWYRWWKEAEESTSGTVSDWKGGILYTASPTSSGPMKIINSIFSSDIVFNLRREDDILQDTQSGGVGISGRDYALVPGEMWLQALKWLVATSNNFFLYFKWSYQFFPFQKLSSWGFRMRVSKHFLSSLGTEGGRGIFTIFGIMNLLENFCPLSVWVAD